MLERQLISNAHAIAHTMAHAMWRAMAQRSARAMPPALARRLGCAAACLLSAAWAPAEEAAYRFSAPIQIRQAAPFVRLALPPSAYGRTEQAELRDLRIIDATGERVPFALLAPRAAHAEVQEQTRDAALYPLPPRPAAGKAWPSPLEVTVQGDRISVRPARMHAGTPAGTIAGSALASPGALSATPPAARSPGWLVDLGDPLARRPDAPPPSSLRLAWSGPIEFSVSVDTEVSDDLRQWRAAGSSQLMALASPRGALLQDRVFLAAAALTPRTRFVRLVWSDAAAAPQVHAVKAVLEERSSVTLDPATEIVVSAQPSLQDDGPIKRALVFDLGGVLPLHSIELRLPSTTQIAPVRVQGRRGANDTWSELGSTVFYRIDRGGQLSTAPPLGLRSTHRYLRLIPDERAAGLDPAQVKLVAKAALASLVFARQGREPFTLQAGAAHAALSALALATLVPALETERARFGEASLGEWHESEDVLRQTQSAERLAKLRPWLLWAVLLAGVAGLGFMVWRLARGAKAGDPA